MSEDKIKQGDVVKLKSGGPEMTVNFIFTDDQCQCAWFQADVMITGKFSPDALMKIDDTE